MLNLIGMTSIAAALLGALERVRTTFSLDRYGATWDRLFRTLQSA